VKRLAAALLVLLSALVTGACGTPKESPPPTGAGCYDTKGRLEPTIRSAGECATNNWTWKTP